MYADFLPCVYNLILMSKIFKNSPIGIDPKETSEQVCKYKYAIIYNSENFETSMCPIKGESCK